MKPEDKDLLLKDLCARLPYWVKVKVRYFYEYEDGTFKKYNEIKYFDAEILDLLISGDRSLDDIKPYLRPMSSMTEEEARDIAILHGNEPVDILSIKVTDEHIDILLDDGVCGTYTETIWYNEIISSLKCFDYLNKNMFDYRGLIPKDLALSTETFNPYKD